MNAADVIHLTHGDGACEAVRALGLPRVQRTRDLLTVGPCAADPVRHRALRLAQWSITDEQAAEGAIGLGDLQASVIGLDRDDPLVLWAATAWSDQVWLWWMLDGFERLGVDRDRLWLAQPRTGHPLESAGAAEPDALREALASARPIGEPLQREAASLWRKYADPSPLDFDAARRAGSRELPHLTASAEVHGAWFPRLVGDSLRLSLFDELVLGSLSREWRTPLELVRGEQKVPLRAAFLPFGDLFLLARLEAWARHGALEHEPRAAGSPWTALAYRLSDAGGRLLGAGLGDVSESPALFIGGCRVHDRAAPWLRISDAHNWQLAPGPASL